MIAVARAAQLAQLRPAGTTAVTAYAAPVVQNVEITRLVICNTTGTAANASVYHDDNGSTYDESTALRFGLNIPANDAVELAAEALGVGYVISGGGSFGVQSDTTDALTFTLYGAVETRAPA